jgi:hypothetical protein
MVLNRLGSKPRYRVAAPFPPQIWKRRRHWYFHEQAKFWLSRVSLSPRRIDVFMSISGTVTGSNPDRDPIFSGGILPK